MKIMDLDVDKNIDKDIDKDIRIGVVR